MLVIFSAKPGFLRSPYKFRHAEKPRSPTGTGLSFGSAMSIWSGQVAWRFFYSSSPTSRLPTPHRAITRIDSTSAGAALQRRRQKQDSHPVGVGQAISPPPKATWRRMDSPARAMRATTAGRRLARTLFEQREIVPVVDSASRDTRNREGKYTPGSAISAPGSPAMRIPTKGGRVDGDGAGGHFWRCVNQVGRTRSWSASRGS